MKIRTIPTLFTLLITLFSIFSLNTLLAQEVEVQGSLKVTQMDADETGEELVIRNADGSLGTRSVATLPTPPPPIDTSRNLASDFELAKFLCDCPNPPPFMIKKLIESGYTLEQLVGAGIPVEDAIEGQRGGILIDPRDNQSYKTVKIGDQVWMAENLNIGAIIDTSINQYNNSIIDRYCYDNDPGYCNTYGGLYQWDEMMEYTNIESSQGICPTGWHIPSDDEWKTLELTLGMTLSQVNNSGYRGTDQGSQLAGIESEWVNGPLDQHYSFGISGFDATPAGFFEEAISTFIGHSLSCNFWSSSESVGTAQTRFLSYLGTNIYRGTSLKESAFSVRCVQD